MTLLDREKKILGRRRPAPGISEALLARLTDRRQTRRLHAPLACDLPRHAAPGPRAQGTTVARRSGAGWLARPVADAHGKQFPH
jgi:hypothetical protein